MPVIKLAHIVNPFAADAASDLRVAQPITFESMRRAQSHAENVVHVELLAALFQDELQLLPQGFRATAPLTRSVSDLHNFVTPLRLPVLADILERAYAESEADYLVYTNVDIGLYPDFYKQVCAFIQQGHDAFIINRRRLPPIYSGVADLENIYSDKGKKHPGFDCFVFHRSIYPHLQLSGICIGVPFVEIAFSQNLFALTKNFKLFDEEVLTFHIGLEIFRRRAPRAYFRYNRRQFHEVEKALWTHMRLERFPYQHLPWPLRLLRWAVHPCIPTRLVIKLWFKRFTG